MTTVVRHFPGPEDPIDTDAPFIDGDVWLRLGEHVYVFLQPDVVVRMLAALVVAMDKLEANGEMPAPEVGP